MVKYVTSCPECNWTMPLSALVDMTWCPCGWRDEKVYNRRRSHNRQKNTQSNS